MVKIAQAAGVEVVIVNKDDNRIDRDEEHERLLDRAGRHFPAHLTYGKTPDYLDVWGLQWWGWHRIAFPPGDDKRRPPFTYWRRPSGT